MLELQVQKLSNCFYCACSENYLHSVKLQVDQPIKIRDRDKLNNITKHCSRCSYFSTERQTMLAVHDEVSELPEGKPCSSD